MKKLFEHPILSTVIAGLILSFLGWVSVNLSKIGNIFAVIYSLIKTTLIYETTMPIWLFLIITLLIVSIMVIYVTAFVQGGSISFWHPAIGLAQKKEPSKEIENTNVETYFYVNRSDYYQKYYSLVSNAKESVVMVGDGFACHKLDNSEYAFGLINSIRNTLENGVLVKRFQYHTTLSLKWLRMLCDLKEEFGDLFQVYMHKDYDPIALPYVICLVDNSQKDASVNVMFTRSSDTSLEEKLAGPAFIFSNGKDLEQLMVLMRRSVNDFFHREYNIGCSDLLNLYDQLKERRRDKISNYFSSQKDLYVDSTSVRKIAKKLGILDVELVLDTAMKEVSNRDELYFAYGSNVDKERIRKRCPSARVIVTGKLQGYKLVFNMMGNKSEGKGGGIANITKSAGDHVYGILYRIDIKELEKLNALEISMNYEVEQLNISVSESVSATAIVYICRQESDVTYVPTKNYKEFILNGMKKHKFPQDYQILVEKIMES